MKKTITSAFMIMLLTIISCATDNAMVSNEQGRTAEQQNFERAMKSLGDPGNRATEEEKRSGSAELSDRRKQLLVPASLELIKSTGISEDEIKKQTNGDITAIIVWALKIDLKKNEEMRNSRKLN